MELQLTEVTKRYGEKVALDHFSYTFHPGIYGILGANGAGKSTMMNLITDNLRRDDGSITFNGEDIRKLGVDYRRVLGYMTQQQGLYEGMTAESFLVYMARLKEIPQKAVSCDVDRVLEMTNLTDVRHKKVGSFSGGMKQRAALIRTLAMDPQLLLLDEPFSALDYQTRLEVADDIESIIRREKKTAILVTHDLSEAISMADRVIILSHRPGTVRQIVPIIFPDQYDTPLKKRNAPEFPHYFDHIWKELKSDG